MGAERDIEVCGLQFPQRRGYFESRNSLHANAEGLGVTGSHHGATTGVTEQHH